MLAWITSRSVAAVIPSASKIGPNSPIDWLARVTICLATGARSAVAVQQRGPACPLRTAASFQARLKPSWIDVLEPSPFDGGCRWAASPMMKTRSDCMCVAYMLLTVQVLAEAIRSPETGSPTSCAHDLRGKGLVHLRFGLVDVVAPDDQPFVPGPDHPHEPMPMPPTSAPGCITQ
jgi:hypothetical protein